MIGRIRSLVAEFAGENVDVARLGDDGDLYRAGMTSHASVQLMLGLEEAFDIEFPEALLTPDTFSSIAAIARALDGLGVGVAS